LEHAIQTRAKALEKWVRLALIILILLITHEKSWAKWPDDWPMGGKNPRKRALEVTVESGGNFEDYVRFLSCRVWSGESWTELERLGEKW
jgi:hypothetical protein